VITRKFKTLIFSICFVLWYLHSSTERTAKGSRKSNLSICVNCASKAEKEIMKNFSFYPLGNALKFKDFHEDMYYTISLTQFFLILHLTAPIISGLKVLKKALEVKTVANLEHQKMRIIMI
jgi:hypothetical protein